MTSSNLKQTKNSFKLIGKVTRIDRDDAYREKLFEKQYNKNDGKLYRSLRFGVKTSETNEITVSTFDFEPEEVFLWNSKKKEENEDYKGERIPFGLWEEQQDELREQGYAVLQSRVGVEFDNKGKVQTKGMPRFVASEYIYNNIDNGDSVVVEGTIRYSKYKNRNDEWVQQKNYTIEKLIRIKDVDFDAEDFEEVSYFEQEMVFIDADVDKKEGKAYVTGRTIDYTKKFEDVQFIVDFSDGEGGYDESMVKLANAFKSSFKFGDVVNVFGDTLNRVLIDEVEDDEDEEEDLISKLGGKSKPKHAQSYVAKSYITEMQIHGVDAWDEGVYSDEDFQSDNLLVEEEKEKNNDKLKGLGGKKKPEKKNPFDIGDDEGIGFDDDDLPF